MLTSLWDHGMQPVQWGAAVTASLVAAAIDVRTHRIPNMLTGLVLLLGLIWSCGVAGWGGLGDGVCGVFVTGLPFFVLWVMRAGGAGDAKMMGALGAWLGVRNGAVALLAVALAGGVVSLGYAIARRQLRSALRNVAVVMGATVMLLVTGRRIAGKRELIPSIQSLEAFPYGIAIFLGTSLAAVGVLWWRSTAR